MSASKWLRGCMVVGILSLTGRAPLQGQQVWGGSSSLQELAARALRDSNDAQVQYDLALAYWHLKQWDSTEHALRTAVIIDPRAAEAWLALGFLPYARRPQLLHEAEGDNPPDSVRAAVSQALRLQRHAFLIDPLVDLRIIGAVFPIKDRVAVPTVRGGTVEVGNPIGAFLSGDYTTAYRT